MRSPRPLRYTSARVTRAQQASARHLVCRWFAASLPPLALGMPTYDASDGWAVARKSREEVWRSTRATGWRTFLKPMRVFVMARSLFLLLMKWFIRLAFNNSFAHKVVKYCTSYK